MLQKKGVNCRIRHHVGVGRALAPRQEGAEGHGLLGTLLDRGEHELVVLDVVRVRAQLCGEAKEDVPHALVLSPVSQTQL